MGFGSTYFGALVFGAGLVVTSMTPVPPPTTGGNGYGTAQFGQHVFGAGAVVTSETPVPPTPPVSTGGNGYGTTYFGAHVFGAGFVVTSQTPVGPAVTVTSKSLGGWHEESGIERQQRTQRQIEAMLMAWLHIHGRNY